MSEERTQILQMLASGRVTVEQADQLLEALGAASPAGALEPATGTVRHRRGDARTGGSVAGLTPEQFIELRNHEVSGAFVQQMRATWLGDVSVEDLIELHDHDVTPRFVRELREAGCSGLTCHELVELRNHGVEAAFAREMRDLGFDNLAPSALIELYNHGVDGDFVREMRGPSRRGEREGTGE